MTEASIFVDKCAAGVLRLTYRVSITSDIKKHIHLIKSNLQFTQMAKIFFT